MTTRRNLLLAACAASVSTPVGAFAPETDPVFAAIAAFRQAYNATNAKSEVETDAEEVFYGTGYVLDRGVNVGMTPAVKIVVGGKEVAAQSQFAFVKTVEEFDSRIDGLVVTENRAELRERVAEYEATIQRARDACGLTAAEADAALARAAEDAALDALVGTVPTTLPGLLAYMEALTSQEGFEGGTYRSSDDFARMTTVIKQALAAQIRPSALA